MEFVLCRETKVFLKCVLTSERSFSLSHSVTLDPSPNLAWTVQKNMSYLSMNNPSNLCICRTAWHFSFLQLSKFPIPLTLLFLRIFSSLNVWISALVLLSSLSSVCSFKVIFLLLINLALLHQNSLCLASLYHLHKLLKLFQLNLRVSLTPTLLSSWFLAIIPD